MASQFRSVNKWKYDVFLNFLREDFNENFVTDLYERLEDIGIKTFKHDDRSARGVPISTEISGAIEESRIAITIFSGKYALSRRCLEESTKIMECVDSHGQEFFPDYRTEPSVVSLEFDYGNYDDALSKASDIAGFNKYYYYYGFEPICW
ncbi:TMV resistance protein N-like [Solanum tuberosum]|uniref:TMV resistance protein N-like n=1 Tax=Solanum tuberosum TaxID=4113 RepID=UPI00073A47A2|nr:PREDICTED: TMV resistance protein N-like [Solanum tuberosum]